MRARITLLTSGLLSQLLKSRKKVIQLFLLLTVASVAAYFSASGVSATTFCLISGLLGFSIGYWAIFVTVATAVPNFVRGMTVPITMLFQADSVLLHPPFSHCAKI